jgi:16S rRNA (guanine1207-N2)-methyltransferase
MAEPDGVDRLLLDEAAAYAGRRTVVVDDVTGALVTGLPEVQGFCCDSLVDERTVTVAAPGVPVGGWLDPSLLAGASLVVARRGS